MAATVEIRPQPGPQEAFLSSAADITIYGGAAFGGKTYGLLLMPLRHIEHPEFGGLIFRRTSKQVRAQGGLWDTAGQIYPQIGAEPNSGSLHYRFPQGSRVGFAHLQHDDDRFSWQGAQLPWIGFDELTHFTEQQFWYLVSRNRDPSGKVRPYISATCNPDPDSFVRGLIDWWIDPDTGLPRKERSGVIRWFVRYHDELVWADDPDDLRSRYPGSLPKSLTFIASSYEDNKLGLAADPGYLANLDALPKVERERLKTGNWNIRPAAGDYFSRQDFHIIRRNQVPPGGTRIRYWDRAASMPSPANPDPDWTVGVLMRRVGDDYYIEHIDRFRLRPGGVQARIQAAAESDGREVTIGIERDPGQAGLVEADLYVRLLSGYAVVVVPATSAKEVRAAPLSAAAQGAGPGQGHVYLVEGDWNDAFLAEAENFPFGRHDDQVDGASGAYNELANKATGPVIVRSLARRAAGAARQLLRGYPA
jgi:predicted phage terminase large subunit-like protein